MLDTDEDLAELGFHKNGLHRTLVCEMIARRLLLVV